MNFLDSEKKVNPHQFQRYFSKDGTIRTSDSKNNFKDYDLKQLILDFNDIAENLLIRCLEKLVNSTYKNRTSKKKTKYLEKIMALKEASKGNIVIWPDNSEELFIIKVRE